MRTQRILLALVALSALLCVVELRRMNDTMESDTPDCLAIPEEAQLAHR
jgi:hypothetical protein